MNGGYSMVNCDGMNLLSQSAQTIKGLYKRVTRAVGTGKPVQAYNCVYGEGVPMTPINVFVIKEDNVYICTASILQVRVASNDSVTITSLLTD